MADLASVLCSSHCAPFYSILQILQIQLFSGADGITSLLTIL